MPVPPSPAAPLAASLARHAGQLDGQADYFDGLAARARAQDDIRQADQWQHQADMRRDDAYQLRVMLAAADVEEPAEVVGPFCHNHAQADEGDDDDVFLIAAALQEARRREDGYNDWLTAAVRAMDCRECTLQLLWMLTSPQAQ